MRTTLPNSSPLCAHLTAERDRRSTDGAPARGTITVLVGLCHPGTWAEDHDLLFWSKGTNAPDSAGRSLTLCEAAVGEEFPASQCACWCSVPPDFDNDDAEIRVRQMSQCT